MTQIDTTLSATGSAVDVPWGSDFPDQTFHFFQHPNNANGQGPTICFFHPGGAGLFDARYAFLNNGNMNGPLSRIFAKTASADGPFFNICAINVPQLGRTLGDVSYPHQPLDTIGNAHTGTVTYGWAFPQSFNERISAPEIWQLGRIAVLAAKSWARTRGADPKKWIFMGPSTGATRAVLTQLSGTLHSDDMTDGERLKYGIVPGIDSRACALVIQWCQVDMRRGPDYVIAAGGDETTYPINFTYIADWCGVRTKDQLDALPAEVLERQSLLWYLEQASATTPESQKIRERLVPIYGYWERNGLEGGGSDPFGEPEYPLPDPIMHDEQNLFNLEATCREHGLKKLLRSAFLNAAEVGVVPGDPLERTYPQMLGDDMMRFMQEALKGHNVRYGRGPVYWSNADEAYYPYPNYAGENESEPSLV